MGNQIIKQPDGKYAIWSSTVDRFIATDQTREDIIADWLNEEFRRIYSKVMRVCDSLDTGGKPYYQLTLSWESARSLMEQIHGSEEGGRIAKRPR